MPTYENIEGSKLSEIFDQLYVNKTLVKVSLRDSDFESLTVVTQIDMEGDDNVFHIDPPDGLLGAIAESNAKSIHFEYNSEDRVTHHFDAEIAGITPENVRCRFPKFIQRHQQRDNFRVKVFYDSFARLTVDEDELRMAIDNVSLGGVFCLCPKKYKTKFSEHQILENMELIFTLEKECFAVTIKQVQVNRFENRPLPKHFGIAFEFVRIKRSAKKILVQQIYELQRHFLKNRLKYV